MQIAKLKEKSHSNDSIKTKVSGKFSMPDSDFPLSITHSDLVEEQQADASLKEIFPLVRPEEELFDNASICHAHRITSVEKTHAHTHI